MRREDYPIRQAASIEDGIEAWNKHEREPDDIARAVAERLGFTVLRVDATPEYIVEVLERWRQTYGGQTDAQG